MAIEIVATPRSREIVPCDSGKEKAPSVWIVPKTVRPEGRTSQVDDETWEVRGGRLVRVDR